MRMSGWISTMCVSLILLAAKGNAQTSDFENLTTGNIQGQDGWTNIVGTAFVTAGTGVDVTNVITGSPGIGVAIRDRGLVPSTQNSSTWIFDANLYSGAFSTAAYGLCTSSGSAPVGFGLSVPGNGAESGTSSFWMLLGSGMYSGVNHYMATPMSANTSDWYRLKLLLDYSANGGDGSASMFEQDLSQGDTAFTPVSGLQNVDLGLTDPALSGSQLADMSDQFVYVTGGGALDNISAQGPPLATPEPAAIQFTGAGLLVVAMIRRRRSKNG